VLEATENLNQRYIIGKGGHGTVYKAMIGQQVFAAKKVEFGRNKQKRLSIIRNEIEVLGMFKHRNLLKHADYWIGEEYGLVLCEFMKNGSLHDILHEKKPPLPLTWNVRCKIAVGIAHGLLYLHYDCVPRIVHRDIKPKNILVDDNMEPIIADFGTALCKKVFEDSNSHSTIRKMLSSHVVGTPGYIAPGN
jgi:serine/threonine protein kinase